MTVSRKRRIYTLLLVALALGLVTTASWGQEPEPPGADMVQRFLTAAEDAARPDRVSGTLLLFFLLTILSLAPAILVMTTCFTRIIVVLGFLRQAMATQQTPPNQVLIGLALFLTFFVMAPTYQQAYDNAVLPYMNESIGLTEAWEAGVEPIRQFMFRNVREKDVALFLNMTGKGRPETLDDIETVVLMPAFVLSELRKAFLIGFIIYIPFLIIDMVVASTLMAMGMMMLPPIFVSLPFKIIMFVLADGWYLVVEELVSGFAR